MNAYRLLALLDAAIYPLAIAAVIYNLPQRGSFLAVLGVPLLLWWFARRVGRVFAAPATWSQLTTLRLVRWVVILWVVGLVLKVWMGL